MTPKLRFWRMLANFLSGILLGELASRARSFIVGALVLFVGIVVLGILVPAVVEATYRVVTGEEK